jgi:hypothetical protein
MAELTILDLTTGALNGTGVFDKLMASTKQHLEAEFDKGRIKGPEYATVYLGALDNVMANALQFLLQKAQIGLQADLLQQQILLAQVEVQKAAIQLQLLDIEKLKATAEVNLVNAQVATATQQRLNMVAEAEKTAAETLNVPKQGELLDAQIVQSQRQNLLVTQQITNLAAELPKIVAEVAEMESRAALAAQQVINLTAEGLNIPKQGEVLDAQVCKLQAEFDLTVNTNTKTTGEIALLTQKTATERAQTLAIGVDPDSIIGKQKSLYTAQTAGFTRDAEQKAAKLLVDTWSARRMSDEGTVADGVNMLQDSTIGRAVNKLLAGVGA